MVGKKKLIIRVLPGFALASYWILLFISTHIPRIPSGMSIHVKDKIIHFSAFLCLTLLFWLAVYGSRRPLLRNRTTWLTVLMLSGYGVLDELTQHFVHRDVSFLDWLSDFGGVVTAIVMLLVLRRWFYWLVIFWGCMFVFTHWPGHEPLLKLPDYLQQYHLVYYLAAYTALTIVWWRSWCFQGYFSFSGPLMWMTLAIIGGYAIFDQWLRMRMQLGWDGMALGVSIAGVGLGIIFSAMMAHYYSELGRETDRDGHSQVDS